MSANAHWYFDIGAVVVIVLVLLFAHYSLATHPFKLLETIVHEFAQLFAGQFTTGAVNALGLVIVGLIGVFILIQNGLGHLLALAMEILRPDKAHEYVNSVSPLTLFIAVGLLAALSAVVTLFRERHG